MKILSLKPRTRSTFNNCPGINGLLKTTRYVPLRGRRRRDRPRGGAGRPWRQCTPRNQTSLASSRTSPKI